MRSGKFTQTRGSGKQKNKCPPLWRKTLIDMARWKISRTPLEGTSILFYGRVPNSFAPLRDTNSTTKNYISGTDNNKK